MDKKMDSPQPIREDAALERPLSPVLSTGKKSNLLKFGGRLKKKVSRTNLSKRFEVDETGQNNVTRETVLLYFANLPDPTDSPEIRLKKLQGMEEKRKEYLRYLTDVQVEGEQVLVSRAVYDDSKFKKPMSPVVLKTKRECTQRYALQETTNNASVQTNQNNTETVVRNLSPFSQKETYVVDEYHTAHNSLVSGNNITLTDSQVNNLADDIESVVSKDENVKANNECRVDNQEAGAYFKYVSQFLEKLEKQKKRNNEISNICQVQAVSDINLHCQNILDLINLVEKNSTVTPTDADLDCPILRGFAKHCIEVSKQKAQFCDNLISLYEKQTKEVFKDVTEEGIELSIYCFKKNANEGIENTNQMPNEKSASHEVKDIHYNDNFITLYQNEKRHSNPRKKSRYACFDKQKLTQEWFDTCFAEGDFKKECDTNTATTDSDSISEDDIKIDQDKSVCHSPGFGFKCASGKKIKVSQAALLKAAKVFDEVIEEVKELKQNDIETIHLNSKFSNDSGKACTLTTATSTENDSTTKTGFDSIRTLQVQSAPTVTFTCASGKGITVSKEAIANAEKMFHEIDDELKCSEPPKSVDVKTSVTGFKSAAGKALSVSADALGSAQKMFTDINQNQDDTVICKTPTNEKKTFKKHLGVTNRTKKIPIEEQNLERAKKMFEDISGDLQMEFREYTPVKVISSCHTPKGQGFGGPYISTPVCNSSPIFFDKFTCGDKTIADVTNISFSRTEPKVILKNATAGSICNWLDELNVEQKKLEHQLQIIYLKQQALNKQKLQLENEQAKKPMTGILFAKKKTNEKISLRQFVGGLKPGDQKLLDPIICSITPKNALSVHFVCNSTVLETLDGAQIIPNNSNLIGISEIKTAFEVMSGVQRSLIPANWIENHYKWIVWKLASMERSFPQHFNCCLTVENIMLQLKYRYDREIDRVERSALRRILEKDDLSQKRMVLCVSDIRKGTGDLFELELTDGWYSIRTIIDSPLNEQINKQKLKLGTKIVTQGAELINCDGCHPLQTPDHVYLKLNYNCTRRAVWDAKLGFQNYPGPLLISLKCISFKGGLIGHIKVYLARVYPLRYMERQGNTVVWRNERAEDKRAKACATEKLKHLEDIQYQVQKNYEKEVEETQFKKRKLNIKESDLPNIHCGDVLHDLLKHSSDPDSIMEKLTPSQRTALEEYKRHHLMELEQDLASRMRDAINKSNIVNRDVVPILKLLLIDASDYSECSMILNIWKPTEELLHILKEGHVFSVYNAVPKNNGSLGSSCKTRFKEETASLTRFKKFSRQVLPIAVTMQPLYKPFLNEFDTIGVVVKTRIGAINQDLWLSDLAGRLLLVKVSDTPDRCSIFDSLERGNVIAISNLILCEPQSSFGFAMGNQYTTVARYPRNKLLREALDMFTQQATKDLSALLTECDKKINICVTKLGFINSLQNKSYSETLLAQTTALNITDLLTDSSEDEGGLPAKLTALDVAMSLIDMDSLARN